LKLVEKRRTHIPVQRIENGDYLEFIYNGKRRSAIVIAKDYKGNADMFEVTELDRDVLLEHIMALPGPPDDGYLWEAFGSVWDFKSFKRDKINVPVKVTFEWEADKK